MTTIPANSPLKLALAFDGVAKFSLVDFRRPQGAKDWTNIAIEKARTVVSDDPGPYDIVPLQPGEIAVLVVAVNMTSADDSASVKASGELTVNGQTMAADSDAGDVADNEYVGLNLRFELKGG